VLQTLCRVRETSEPLSKNESPTLNVLHVIDTGEDLVSGVAIGKKVRLHIVELTLVSIIFTESIAS